MADNDKEIEMKNFANGCRKCDTVNTNYSKPLKNSRQYIYDDMTEQKFASILKRLPDGKRVIMLFERGQIVITIKVSVKEKKRFFTMIVHSTSYIHLHNASYDWICTDSSEGYGYGYYSDKDIWIDTRHIINRYNAGEFSNFVRIPK